MNQLPSIELLILGLIIVLIYYYYTGGNEQNLQDLESRVKLVSSMFPHVPKSLIENDLRAGSRVEETCEKIISGRLERSQVSTINNNQRNNVDSSATSSKISQSLHMSEILSSPILEEAPPKIWESESDKRQNLLKQRKAYMIQQARFKFLNKD